MYGDFIDLRLSSDTNTVSSSSSFVEVIIDPTGDPFKSVVLKIDLTCSSDFYIEVFRKYRCISNTDNEKEVILDLCVPREKVCLFRPSGSPNEFFYFYDDIMGVLRVRVPFTIF